MLLSHGRGSCGSRGLIDLSGDGVCMNNFVISVLMCLFVALMLLCSLGLGRKTLSS